MTIDQDRFSPENKLSLLIKPDMKVLQFFLAFFILLTGCSSPENKNKLLSENETALPVIDIENAIKSISNTPFKCSEFIDSIEYLPLETNKESVFGNGQFAVPILPASEFVYCDLKKFSLKTGKFIYQVGRRGRGPGEFSMAIASTTDIENNRVFVLDNWTHNINIYDNNNNFIKKLDVLPEIQRIMYLKNDKLILFRSNAFYGFTIPFEYQIYDINEDKVTYTREIKSLKESVYGKDGGTFMSFGIGRNSHWYYMNNVQLYESFTDTIFTIETDGTRIPRFYVNRKNSKPPLSEIIDNKLYESHKSEYIEITSVFETPKYIFLLLRKGIKEFFCARFDKVNPQTIIVPLIGAFENDLTYSHFTSFINMSGQSDGIDYFDIAIQKEKILTKMGEIPSSEWSKSAKRLHDLISKANPDDNGLICIYRLKAK